MFWLVMNKGQYTASPSKIFLTIVNLVIFGIACAIVRPPQDPHWPPRHADPPDLVRSGTLRVRQIHPRQLVLGQLDVRQQRHISLVPGHPGRDGLPPPRVSTAYSHPPDRAGLSGVYGSTVLVLVLMG